MPERLAAADELGEMLTYAGTGYVCYGIYGGSVITNENANTICFSSGSNVLDGGRDGAYETEHMNRRKNR